MKVQLQQFLRNELQLELSMDKTQITHVQEGFDFLGFHLRYIKEDNRERLVVKPTTRNIDKLKDKIRRMTSEDTHLDNDYAKLQAINAILRGWSGYYKHVSSSRIFSALDFWTDMRVLRWLSAKHKLGIMAAVARFKRQQTPTLRNIGIQFKEKEFLWLHKMAKERHTPYHRQSISNPFITTKVLPLRSEGEPSDLSTRWSGIRPDSAWRDVRFAALARDHYRCTNPACGSTQNLDVHHIIPRAKRPELALDLNNLATLCEKCHIATHGRSVLNSRIIAAPSLHEPDRA